MVDSESQARVQGPFTVGQVVADRYLVRSALASGGMGIVYVVRHLALASDFVLKAMLPELQPRSDLVQRFISEARAAAAIKHPGITQVLDFGVHDGVHFFVMEKLEGEDLARRLASGPLSVELAARLGADMADVIAAAHRHQIIHRDLKPQNVFLARDEGRKDVVKILDFGTAKLTDPELVTQSLTASGEIYGTALYMSPEQLVATKHVDARTDVYAMGAILYHALAGRPPYEGATYPQLAVNISAAAATPLTRVRPETPDSLAAIVAKAMARDRDQRLGSADELRDLLRAFLAGEDCSVDKPRAAAPAASSGRRRLALAVAGAALAVGAAAVAKCSTAKR